jgi:hypothetical protein
MRKYIFYFRGNRNMWKRGNVRNANMTMLETVVHVNISEVINDMATSTTWQHQRHGNINDMATSTTWQHQRHGNINDMATSTTWQHQRHGNV